MGCLDLPSWYRNNNTNGVTFTNQSAGYVRYSKINSNMGNSGINCAQNSNPIIRPNNQLKYNTPAGLSGDYNSLPEMGSLGQNGNNSISNSDDDAWSENSNRVNTL
jgi:P pilus assembly chaperone PapD